MKKVKSKYCFVGVEGVYSMDGDIAPLDEIVPICKKYDAILIVDDAHGTGVMGKEGSGTQRHFGLEVKLILQWEHSANHLQLPADLLLLQNR